MPEQHISDRDRLLEQIREAEKRGDEQGLCAIKWLGHASRCDREDYWIRGMELARGSVQRAAHHALTAQTLRDALDNHPIALSYEAQIQAQDQQIRALRAEQARLRAQNERLKAVLQQMAEAYEIWMPLPEAPST